jgi:hypothetical protein
MKQMRLVRIWSVALKNLYDFKITQNRRKVHFQQIWNPMQNWISGFLDCIGTFSMNFNNEFPKKFCNHNWRSDSIRLCWPAVVTTQINELVYKWASRLQKRMIIKFCYFYCMMTEVLNVAVLQFRDKSLTTNFLLARHWLQNGKNAVSIEKVCYVTRHTDEWNLYSLMLLTKHKLPELLQTWTVNSWSTNWFYQSIICAIQSVNTLKVTLWTGWKVCVLLLLVKCCC